MGRQVLSTTHAKGWKRNDLLIYRFASANTPRYNYWYDDGGDIYKVEIFEPYIKWKLFRRFRLVATLRAEEKYRNEFVKVARHSVLNYV